MDIDLKIKNIITKYLVLEKHIPLKLSDHIAQDLGADSLDAIEITISIEEEFKIEIPDEVAENLLTVGQIIEYVKSKKEAAENE